MNQLTSFRSSVGDLYPLEFWPILIDTYEVVKKNEKKPTFHQCQHASPGGTTTSAVIFKRTQSVMGVQPHNRGERSPAR